MRIWYHNTLDARREVFEVTKSEVRVGSSGDCDLRLMSPFVAGEAALLRIDSDGQGGRLRVLGRAGCKVDDEAAPAGAERRFGPESQIELFPYRLEFEQAVKKPGASESSVLDKRMASLLREVHIRLLDAMDVDGDDERRRENDEYLLRLERSIDEIASTSGLDLEAEPELVQHVAGQAVHALLVGTLINRSGDGAGDGLFDGPRGWSRHLSGTPELEARTDRLVRQIGERIGLEEDQDLGEAMSRVDERFAEQWRLEAGRLPTDFRLYLAHREVKKQIKDIVFGYGPLEDLLRMPIISEIMVVSKDQIYVERQGVVERSGRRFISDEVTLTIANRIVSRVGRSVNKSRPLVDARLLDGSRVNVVIPPLAVSGPCLTIRKFPTRRFTLERLTGESGSLTNEAAEFLRAAVLARKNVLVAGGTGSGKTTLLNCLSDCIGEKERIVTVEDTAELQLAHEHVVRLETKSANAEGGGEYSIRDLVKNALRMRPDRIVVGECRGGEALDMLQAMNTGHDGSMTTVHANSPEDVVRRLEVMAQSSDIDLDVASIHSQVSSAIDLVVQLQRDSAGRRRVTHITEVLRQNRGEEGVRTRDLFRTDSSTGRLTPTGRLPTFIDQLLDEGQMSLELMYP